MSSISQRPQAELDPALRAVVVRCFPTLTARQVDAVAHLAAGRIGTPELAAAMGVATNTAHNHLKATYGATGTRSKAGVLALLLRVVLRDGLVVEGGKLTYDFRVPVGLDPALRVLPNCSDCPIGGRDGDGPECPKAPLCDAECALQVEAMASDRG